MQWILRKKIPILAYAVFFLPALLIPAFDHDQTSMKAYVYLAWLFATPLAALIGCLSKPRRGIFYLGIATLLTPVEIIWYLAFVSMIHVPEREKVAELYMPIILLTSMFLLPIGFWLTYVGSRQKA